MDLVGYYLTVYMPLILGQLGFGSPQSRVLGGAVMNVSFLLGYIPLALLVDKIGRITPQIVGFLGSAVALTMVGLAATHLQSVQHRVGGHLTTTIVATGATLTVIFIAMLLSQVTNSFGPGSTTYILPSEVYPTDLRATGHGFATAFSRLGAVTSLFFLPIIEYRMAKLDFYLLLAALSVLGALLTWIFRVDTTGCALLQDLAPETEDSCLVPALEPTYQSEPAG
jgi:putative MFS transporter